MLQYRYIPHDELVEAPQASVTAIRIALGNSSYRILGRANRYILGPWKMSYENFISALRTHFEAGGRLFTKVVTNPPKNQEIFHANINLDQDIESEENDAYVEIRLQDGQLVIIVDAHNHNTPRRLPKR